MKKHNLIILLVCAGVLIANNLPLLSGIFNSDKSFIFLGRHSINFQDNYPIIALIEQSRQGRFLFENLYMSEPQHPSLFRPSYLLIGKLAAITNMPSGVAYHLARIALTLLFFATLYKFLQLFFKGNWQKTIAFIIILTSSGLGYALSRFATESTDAWIPESITFLALAEAPHFILSQILMISGLFFYLKGLKESRVKYVTYAGLLFFLLSFEHPYNIAVLLLAVIISAFWFKAKKHYRGRQIFKATAIIILFMIVGLGYQIFETYQNPVLRAWAAQNLLLSPDPPNYLYGYGLILIFAIIGLEYFLTVQNPQQILLLSWILATAGILYFPIFFQRRFIEGLHIPLAIIASQGVFLTVNYLSKLIADNFKETFNKAITVIIIAVLSVSSAAVIYKDIGTIGRDTTSAYFHHILKSELTALNWLETKTNSNDVILTNWFYGNILPGLTGRKVYVGHKVQTPYFDEKVENINKFLVNKNSTEAYKFLQQNHITYIFLGKADTMLQYGFKPDEKPYLIKIYDRDGVLIYKAK